MMIEETKECWEGLASFRKKRMRCRDYTFGRQWNDVIEIDGRKMTEYEYILREGNVPLKNNLIRRIVRNVLGVFRDKLSDIMREVYGGELAGVAERNDLHELFCRSMEEFLISGMVVHRKRLVFTGQQTEIITEAISPGCFFFNSDSGDSRGWDLKMIGQIHKVDFNDWCKAFVKNSGEFLTAKKIFGDSRRYMKVTEVWRKEMVPFYLIHDRIKGVVKRVPEKEVRGIGDSLPRKWILDEIWRFYFLTEDGTVLFSGDSPYLHGGHPYVLKCYPFLDGEIQSFVADMIDQQRYTNRLITLYDWVVRASAKGVLLIPEGTVAPGNLKNVADQWGRFNGVIVYKADPSKPEPKQINSNTSNLGISELLEIQLKMIEDVSGVNGILQGNTTGGNVSGELYNSQTANAMYSLSDIMQTFTAFIRDCAEKDRMLLKQKEGDFL